jgi:hypothetical protein
VTCDWVASICALGQRRLDLDTARDQVQATVTQAWGQLEAAKARLIGLAIAEQTRKLTSGFTAIRQILVVNRGAKVCQRQLVNEVLGPLVTQFALNLAREDATPIQRGFHGGLLNRV